MHKSLQSEELVRYCIYKQVCAKRLGPSKPGAFLHPSGPRDSTMTAVSVSATPLSLRDAGLDGPRTVPERACVMLARGGTRNDRSRYGGLSNSVR